MTYPEELQDWFNSHRGRLESLGDARCVWDPTGRTEGEFCGVYLELPDESIEILVWAAGQAEFDRGAGDSLTFEHFDLHSSEDLATVLRSVEDYLAAKPSM